MNEEQESSVFIHHESCPRCGSRDNLARYSDGHGHCFGCGHYEHGDGEPQTQERTKIAKELITDGDVQALSKRGIDADTCARFGYVVAVHNGSGVQIAPYRNADGVVVAQKVRDADKNFYSLGDMKAALPLWGMWLWKDAGRKVIITEGEIDAMSVSKMQGNKWPVVSIKNGAQAAEKNIRAALEWLNGFDEVVLCFDNDDPGRAAAIACAEALPPGKAKIANLEPFKDANEMLVKGKGEELINRLWQAKAYRPDGIVSLADIREEILAKPETGLPWFSDTLTKLTYGRRYGEVVAFGAGTGTGKTDWLLEQIEYDTATLGLKVGAFFLEQQPAETAKRIASKHTNKLFYLPDAGWEQQELVDALDAMIKENRLFFYNHFGVTAWDGIKSKIRFLHAHEGVRVFYLDHLTALATGQDNEERVELERIMAEIGGLVKELDILIHLVSHLATPEGKPHEEGGRVMIRHFKGSRAIGFWCHFMFGLERDQQAAALTERQTTTFRILKDRLTGKSVGETVRFRYDAATGRLNELNEDMPARSESDDACPF